MSPLFPFVPSKLGLPLESIAQMGRCVYLRFFSRFIGGSETKSSSGPRLSAFMLAE